MSYRAKHKVINKLLQKSLNTSVAEQEHKFVIQEFQI